ERFFRTVINRSLSDLEQNCDQSNSNVSGAPIGSPCDNEPTICVLDSLTLTEDRILCAKIRLSSLLGEDYLP
ncbi:hypothetical protein CEXT_749781, partial [Caerostris extrusa]